MAKVRLHDSRQCDEMGVVTSEDLSTRNGADLARMRKDEDDIDATIDYRGSELEAKLSGAKNRATLKDLFSA